MLGAWEILFFLIFAAILFLLVTGGYVFFAACVRKSEPDWLEKEMLEKTPFLSFYDSMVAIDRWLKRKHAQSLYITSHDGLKLHGLWVPAEASKGTVIAIHGYRSTPLLEVGNLFEHFHDAGFNLLIPDHRAHGKSQGKVITFGVKECEDMRRWIEYHNNQFGSQPILLYGISMGAATSMYTTALPIPKNVRGVIADCGFTAPKEIISLVFKRTVHMPIGPVMWSADLFARLFGGFSFYGKDSRKLLKNCTIPILFIHGEADKFVPCYMTKQSYAACESEKQLEIFEDAGHAICARVNYPRYIRAVEEFMNACMKEG